MASTRVAFGERALPNMQRRELLTRIGTWVALLIAVLLVLFPIYWMLITSLKLPREIYRVPSLWPQVFTAENYRIRDVARIVEEVVPGSQVSFADGAGPDLRNYRVNCDKYAAAFPDHDALL